MEELKEDLKEEDKHNDFQTSACRLLELKNNRHVDDISLDDPYWIALKVHVQKYGAK